MCLCSAVHKFGALDTALQELIVSCMDTFSKLCFAQASKGTWCLDLPIIVALCKSALFAETYIKFLDIPPRSNSSEPHKQFLVHILIDIFEKIAAAESLCCGIRLEETDRQSSDIKTDFTNPTLFWLLNTGFQCNRAPVCLTKAAFLRHIAATQPWSATKCIFWWEGWSHCIVPPVLASAVEHAMQAQDMDAHITFHYKCADGTKKLLRLEASRSMETGYTMPAFLVKCVLWIFWTPELWLDSTVSTWQAGTTHDYTEAFSNT